ncbi:hypothetical protein NEFER03_1232 [Nematocida sp. LUAm3]|nr:hypothetical protein NEFER03_1232 [Nematocida sp. LUAm3]KAI5175841.1 hypothetical protein NEFER02_1710 [Nematocida sp. LUAm2]KAI5178337.1 hypothetical protein NEFER01_1504 [Nematocida sp. LUAm1]
MQEIRMERYLVFLIILVIVWSTQMLSNMEKTSQDIRKELKYTSTKEKTVREVDGKVTSNLNEVTEQMDMEIEEEEERPVQNLDSSKKEKSGARHRTTYYALDKESAKNPENTKKQSIMPTPELSTWISVYTTLVLMMLLVLVIMGLVSFIQFISDSIYKI